MSKRKDTVNDSESNTQPWSVTDECDTPRPRAYGDVSELYRIPHLPMRGWDSAAWLSLYRRFRRSSGTQPRSVTRLLRRRTAQLRASERRRVQTARKFADAIAADYDARWLPGCSPEEATAMKKGVAAALRYLASNRRDRELFNLFYNDATPEEWAEYERRERLTQNARYKRVHDLTRRLRAQVEPYWEP